MIPLYTEEEFNSAKSRQLLPLQCKHCGKVFHQFKSQIQAVISGHIGIKYNCCSKECDNLFRYKPIFVKCEQCGKEFHKKTSQIKKSKHHFCSHSCSCTYQNHHKAKGTRISKLEKWLASKLPVIYPDLEFHFNRKDTINSELDIYIPSIRLAFELNGIFHYEPIFGKDTLDKCQNNDNRKTIACYEQGIELCIIDVSKHKYFKESTCIPFLKIIQDIILLKLSRVSQEDPIPETT